MSSGISAGTSAQRLPAGQRFAQRAEAGGRGALGDGVDGVAQRGGLGVGLGEPFQCAGSFFDDDTGAGDTEAGDVGGGDRDAGAGCGEFLQGQDQADDALLVAAGIEAAHPSWSWTKAVKPA